MGFLKIGILTGGRIKKANLHYHAKFRGDRLNGS